MNAMVYEYVIQTCIAQGFTIQDMRLRLNFLTLLESKQMNQN